jgi:ATP-independent RNA helicase DbpA
MKSNAFDSLGLPPPLLQGVLALGFGSMTPVQAEALPEILAGKDVLAQAETGSGKTLAFGLGMLVSLSAEILRVQALAVCPTRELAEQVSEELRRLARRTPNIKVVTLCGGVRFGAQRDSLKQGVHVVVGTPGRLEEHLRKGSLQLEQLKVLVIDEADRLLDMGFEPQLAALTAHAPKARQTLLFSATYPESITELSQRYQRDALCITVPPTDPAEAGSARVLYRFHRVLPRDRQAGLAAFLSVERPDSTLVFCNTRDECESLADGLRALGWVAASLHGEVPQPERQHVTRLFANQSCSVLIATDVAARGLDIAGLAAVVNLGLPRDPTLFLHRVGRTGRSGHSGMAISFVSKEDELPLAALERQWDGPLPFEGLPPAPTGDFEPPAPPMATLLLSAGKDKKIRPGDILGALTAPGGVDGADVGSIQIGDAVAYVAVRTSVAARALAHLQQAPVKGRTVRVRRAGLRLRDT